MAPTFEVLSAEALKVFCQQRFPNSSLQSLAKADYANFYTEYDAVIAALKRNLGERWPNRTDYSICEDLCVYQRQVGLAIESVEAFKGAFLRCIQATLADFPNEWSVSCWCEVMVNPKGGSIAECCDFRGEFLVTKNSCLIEDGDAGIKWVPFLSET